MVAGEQVSTEVEEMSFYRDGLQDVLCDGWCTPLLTRSDLGLRISAALGS